MTQKRIKEIGKWIEDVLLVQEQYHSNFESLFKTTELEVCRREISTEILKGEEKC